jgi:hypothetical protein
MNWTVREINMEQANNRESKVKRIIMTVLLANL